MQSYTISNQNGPVASRGHNIRDKRSIKNQLHIDSEGISEIWHDEKPRDAYVRIFGAAVREYNRQQSRRDRRIQNYYNTIMNDPKKKAVYETIITIGNRDERIDDEVGKAIMKEYVDTWKERNPTLELIGAYYHADERDLETGIRGAAHVHIDYIPVARNYATGLSVRNSHTQAFTQMGIESAGANDTAQMRWQARERLELSAICRKHGIATREVRDQRHHLDTETYRKTKELERKSRLIAEADTRLADAEYQAEIADSELDDILAELEMRKSELDKYRSATLTPEEVAAIKPTDDGSGTIELAAEAFAALKAATLDATEDKQKKQELEKMLQEMEAALREKDAETQRLNEALVKAGENAKWMGTYADVFVKAVRKADPDLANAANKEAIRATNIDVYNRDDSPNDTPDTEEVSTWSDSDLEEN